jgi:hypothetical protein
LLTFPTMSETESPSVENKLSTLFVVAGFDIAVSSSLLLLVLIDSFVNEPVLFEQVYEFIIRVEIGRS